MTIDAYDGIPELPAFHKVSGPRGTVLPDPPEQRHMDHIPELLTAIRELTTELHGVALLLQGQAESAGPRKRVRQVLGGGGDAVPRATWLTEIGEAWDAEMGAGSFPYGPAAKPLKALVSKGHSVGDIARRLGYYLRDAQRRNSTQYVSVAKFAQTFRQWEPDDLAFPDDE
jgi:hypothetical protein